MIPSKPKVKKVKKERGLVLLKNGERVLRIKPGLSLEYMQEKYPHNTYEVVSCIPSMATLEKWSIDGVCKAVDGCCGVEPDGHCRHNKPSWLLALGYL